MDWFRDLRGIDLRGVCLEVNLEGGGGEEREGLLLDEEEAKRMVCICVTWVRIGDEEIVVVGDVIVVFVGFVNEAVGEYLVPPAGFPAIFIFDELVSTSLCLQPSQILT